MAVSCCGPATSPGGGGGRGDGGGPWHWAIGRCSCVSWVRLGYVCWSVGQIQPMGVCPGDLVDTFSHSPSRNRQVICNHLPLPTMWRGCKVVSG